MNVIFWGASEPEQNADEEAESEGNVAFSAPVLKLLGLKKQAANKTVKTLSSLKLFQIINLMQLMICSAIKSVIQMFRPKQLQPFQHSYADKNNQNAGP